MAFSVYIIENKDNGKKYIGQTIMPVKKRWAAHVRHAKSGSNMIFHRAIRKYGEENFLINVIEECFNVSELNEKEKYWISYYNTCYGDGYNNEEGGRNGIPNKETRKKMSIAATGRKHSESTKEKMSERMKGNTYNKNRSCPDHVKQILSDCHKGNSYALGYRHTDEAKMKISESQYKPVAQYDFDNNLIETYKSIKEAAEIIGGKKQAISSCCRGIKKSHRGFIWKFIVESE